MSGYQDVFERVEKKYLLNKTKYLKLMEAFEPIMQKDDYGLHTISNLYFDTEDYRLIRTSLEKPVYKEKLRLRSYGKTDADSPSFIEIKKKYNKIVYKRRISMPYKYSLSYLTEGEKNFEKNQISEEIDYFLNLYKPQPKVFIAYDRTAYFAKEDPKLRITFDTNMRFREVMLDLSKGSFGIPIIGNDYYLMEIKILGAMPIWLCNILSDLEIYPASFSKYGYCYKNHILNKINNMGGIHCA